MDAFASELRRRREARGLSQPQLAALINYHRTFVSKIENGREKASRRFAAACDQALAANGDLVELAPADTAQRPDVSRWTQPGAEALARRLAEHLPTGAESAPLPPLAAHAHEWLVADREPLRAAARGGRVGTSVTDALGSMVDVLRRMDDADGGARLVALVEPELQFTARLINQCSYSLHTARALLLRFGELAQLAGWFAFDTGNYRIAERYLTAALEVAGTIDDRMLGTYVLFSLGFLATDTGRPREAVTILQTAQYGLRDVTTPVTQAVLRTWQARAHAHAGERRQFETSIARASNDFDRGPRPDDASWAYWMIQPELTAEAGRSFALVGDPNRATIHLVQGLAELTDEYPRDQALYMSYLAEANLTAGNHDAATYHTHRAAERLNGLHSPRVEHHLRGIQQRLRQP